MVVTLHQNTDMSIQLQDHSFYTLKSLLLPNVQALPQYFYIINISSTFNEMGGKHLGDGGEISVFFELKALPQLI
jgi:hypothetical protein